RTGPDIMPGRGFPCKSAGLAPAGGRGRSLLLRCDQHDHLPALQAGTGLDDHVVAQVGLDPGGHLPAQLLVAHLAATEADVDLDLVALLDEATDVAQLDLVVALVGDRPELQFLDLDLLLALPGLAGLLLLLEPELAEVHDLADRRIGVGLDLDKVKAFLLGQLQCLVAREDADHFAVGADHTHARHADLVVAAMLLFEGANTAVSGMVGGPAALPPDAAYRFLTDFRRDTTGQARFSAASRAANASTGITPRSSPERVRTATVPAAFSRSPMTRR